MNKKSMRNVYAVIDVGSNFVRMQISQVVKNQLRLLEELEYPVGLGHDVFYDGRIHYHSITALTEVLSKYQECLSVYPIRKCRIVSCSALRYAENREVVRDIVKTQQNIEIEVLEENEEKALLYFNAIKDIHESEATIGGKYLIAYIGTGSIGLAMFQSGRSAYTQNIQTGALKMYDLLGEMRRESEDFYEVIDEYVDTFLTPFRGFLSHLDYIVLTGPEIEMLAKLTGAVTTNSVHVLEADRLFELHNMLRKMTVENIALRYKILEDEAAMLYHTLFICVGLMRINPGKQTIIAPDVDISKAVMRELTNSHYEKEFIEFKREGALSCAEKITAQWHNKAIDPKKLEDIACRLFTKLQQFHGMESALKVILKVASQFVSSVPFWSFQSTSEAICNLVRNIELFGLSQEEIDMLALVTGYMEAPADIQKNLIYQRLGADSQLTVMKLTAISSIALALCKDNLHDIRITLHEKQRKIVFNATTDTGALHGKWSFQQCESFFQDVFGLQPVLTIKLKML